MTQPRSRKLQRADARPIAARGAAGRPAARVEARRRAAFGAGHLHQGARQEDRPERRGEGRACVIRIVSLLFTLLQLQRTLPVPAARFRPRLGVSRSQGQERLGRTRLSLYYTWMCCCFISSRRKAVRNLIDKPPPLSPARIRPNTLSTLCALPPRILSIVCRGAVGDVHPLVL